MTGTVAETLADRHKRYGVYAENAEIAQHLKSVVRGDQMKWLKLNVSQRESLDVICDKISRILGGDPNYPDNWHDIAGYALLIEKQLLGENP